MEPKKLGVIGGMGPKATSVFFEKLVENTVANKDQDHIDTVILNHATLPDRTEAILTNKGLGFINAVKKDIELLEQVGVSNIAIPCNTSHYYYKEMQAMTHVNIINMVEETIEFVRSKYGEQSKVGILATNGTIASGVYENECEKKNLSTHIPNEADQQQIMTTIYNIKSDAEFQATELESIIHELIHVNNCTCVILGCTELSTVHLNDEVKAYCVDPLEILVEKSIVLSGKQTNKRLLISDSSHVATEM